MQKRDLLLPFGAAVAVIVITFLATTRLEGALYGVGVGVGIVLVCIVFLLTLWIENRTPPPQEAVKAVVPLQPLPPYQPMRQEPVVTIQIPARTAVLVLLMLAVFSVIYFRVLRENRGD